MLLNINLFKLSPCKKFMSIHKNNMSDEIQDWIKLWGLIYIESGDYINITPERINNIFAIKPFPEILDGFSPNMNKKLHIGHLSNLIIAKSLSSLYNVQPIYMVNIVDGVNDTYKAAILDLMNEFDYNPTQVHPLDYSSNLPALFKDGEGDFTGTKYIEIDCVKKVCIKKDGSTSYFMEDLSYLYSTNESIMYITGNEQIEHFNVLKQFSIQYLGNNNVDHIPCGLVKLNGHKISSREGNVIYADELIESVASMFEGNRKLAWNIIAGQILMSQFKSDKVLDLDRLKEPKTSVGLYLSYTIARLNRAGIKLDDTYISDIFWFVINQSKENISCHTLLNYLRHLAGNINQLYDDKSNYDIGSGNKDVIELFNSLGSELLYGMRLIGLYKIDKV